MLEHRINFINVPEDISKPEAGVNLVKAVIKKWARFDIFISNAGICDFTDFFE